MMHKEQNEPLDFETVYLIGFNENIDNIQSNAQDEQLYRAVNLNSQNMHIKVPQILGQFQNPHTKKLIDHNKKR